MSALHWELEAALTVAGQAFDSLQQLERDLAAHQASKADVRLAAIKRIMEQPAPSGKPHSYTSAESLRDTDPTYSAWKTAELARSQAKAHAEFILGPCVNGRATSRAPCRRPLTNGWRRRGRA